ncbi:FecR family protein [Parapedobacter deserti]|uniref:FecR family protein n=1 Tax=Parapedobacter deserti TaxID=1912957 RepID=A0ABV7JHP6_9SPHI
MESSKLKELINRYQSGKATSAERYVVDCWLESLQKAGDRNQALDDPGYLSSFQQELLFRVLGEAHQPRNRYPRIRWAIAALVLCTVSLSILFYFRQVPNKADPAQKKMVQTSVTGVNQVKRLLLPDSTVVYLNANTSLQLPANFGADDRVVKLVGEAYFEVKHDSTRPFIVTADDLQVTVLGTAFNVSAYAALADIEVTVGSGRVQVADAKRTLGLLHAEEGITYNRQTADFQYTRAQPTTKSLWREGVDVLADAPFAVLAQVLYNRYGVQLESTDPQVRTSSFHFTMRATRTLEQTMEQLSEMLKKKYRKEGNRIIIY